MATSDPWEYYSKVRASHDAGQIDECLKLIEAGRVVTESIRPYIGCIEASCYEKLGKKDESLSILESFTFTNSANFWVYYQLGATYRNAGYAEKGFAAYREAHSVIGWEESKKNGYVFTHDFFSPNVQIWERWFAENITQSDIKCLEVGSWQGGSATWLLDKIISKRNGSLICIDTFEGSSEHAAWINDIGYTLEEIFDRNVSSTGHASQVLKMKGFSQKVLRSMADQIFDFIYIDGAHEARYALEDAVLSWSLIRPGGFLLFDDVDFTFEKTPDQNTGIAVDSFVNIYKRELKVIETGRQMLIQKLL